MTISGDSVRSSWRRPAALSHWPWREQIRWQAGRWTGTGWQMPRMARHLRQAVVARTGSGRYLAPRAGSARAKTAGFFVGERGESEDGAGQRWGQHVMLAAVVVVADLGVEPGREDGQQVVGGDVVGRGEPAEAGGEDFTGEQGHRDRQWPGLTGLRRCCRGGRSWCPAWPAGVLTHLVVLKGPAEGLVAAWVAQGGHFGEQRPGAQVRVVGEAAAAVAGERQEGIGRRGAFAGLAVPLEVGPDGGRAAPQVPGD